MKKIIIIAFSLVSVLAVAAAVANKTINSDTDKKVSVKPDISTETKAYVFPDFYRGIYLTQPSGKNPEKLARFIEMAKKSNINTLVIDVQPGPGNTCATPALNVKMILDAGLHPIARVVCFQDGLTTFPVSKEKLESIYAVSESAAKNGFKEIQLDYIRFEDSSKLKHLSLEQRYSFVETLISTTKERVKSYNIRVAADVFGRIPLNKNDIIGQRMESMDKVADVICPMAYPSHYTWSQKMIKDPYFTVYTTSVRAKERVANAQIVPYIQAFQMKVKQSGLSFQKYQEEQIKAVHDAKVGGYIFWNAAQEYATTYKALQNYYNLN
ncbi:MAG: glycosyl hydrolase [Spirochaetes bacterium]|nr:glycosyl hydrolase [Spirochaetota bacterium]